MIQALHDCHVSMCLWDSSQHSVVIVNYLEVYHSVPFLFIIIIIIIIITINIAIITILIYFFTYQLYVSHLSNETANGAI